MVLVILAGCRASSKVVPSESVVEEHSAVEPSTPTDAGADEASIANAKLAAAYHASVARGAVGVCGFDASAPATTPVPSVDAWLAAHRTKLVPDASCWGRTSGMFANECSCFDELRLPNATTFLVCHRTREVRAYGWRHDVVLYVLEGEKLRVALELTNGMSANNVEGTIPGLELGPELDGDVVRFREGSCHGCPDALEKIAAVPVVRTPTDDTVKMLADYRAVCALDTFEWRWNGRSFTKRLAGSH